MFPYIKIFGISIPTYGLCICIAVFFCVVLVLKKTKNENIDFNDFMIFSAVTIGIGMFGGGLLYIIVTYSFETIYQQIISGDFSFFKKTGTVFYGGLIGGVSAALIVAKILKIRIEALEKCIVPYIPLGHAIGRIGCLLAGCCYGLPYRGIFAVTTVFDSSVKTYFPIQGIEAFFNLLIMTVLLFYTKRERIKYSVISLYLILYSFARFFLEWFRGDVIRGHFLILSTSQWISLMILLFCSVLMLCTQRKKYNRRKN